MQKIKDILIIIALTLFICSCGGSKVITGEITEAESGRICVPSACFKLKKGAPKSFVGDSATFTPTVNRKKINSRILKP